jgi:6-phosphogluconolactonase
MKFNTMIRTGVAAVTSLAAALGMGACSRDYTSDYVYSISSQGGTISAYAVDYQSGILTQISGSPFSSQLTNPGYITSTPSGKFIYAIGGTQNAQVEPFSVGTDGKLFGEATVNITGTYPLSATVDSTGTWLFVTYRYQTQYSPASPGPGGLSIFKINSDGTLATPTNVNLGMAPVGVTVTPPICTSTPLSGSATAPFCGNGQTVGNVFVYVTEQASTSQGAVIAFSLNNSTGALTLRPGNTCGGTPTVCTGITAGVTPSAIAAEPTGRYVYVTDETSNEIFGFNIGSSSNQATAGILSAQTSSPYATGLFPVAVVVEPRGKYLYTANYNGNTVSSYNINSADGSLGGTASVGNFTTGTGPICLTVEPALGIYLYTADNLSQQVTGGQLNPNTGQLTAIQTTPFPSAALPSCITSVPNGARAQQVVNPN